MGGICTSANNGSVETAGLLAGGGDDCDNPNPNRKIIGGTKTRITNVPVAAQHNNIGVSKTTATAATNTTTSESAAASIHMTAHHNDNHPDDKNKPINIEDNEDDDAGEEKIGVIKDFQNSFHAATVIREVRTRRASQHLFQNLVVENIARDIEDYYDVHTWDVLGDGLSGIVVRAIHRQSGLEYAVKTLHKKSIKVEEYKQVKEEILVMQELDHPNILRLHEYYEDESFIFLVSELCNGGELLHRLHKQKSMNYSEKTACKYVFQMVSAIRYIHSHDIVHRDLKLENFLFVHDGDDSDLKLIGMLVLGIHGDIPYFTCLCVYVCAVHFRFWVESAL
jgi:hypothetical protein